MSYTEKEVMQYVREEDVKFIRLAFCDIYGRQKNVSIMPYELERAFDSGISFDASAIGGFGRSVASDLFLRPDPSTLAVLPWRPDHGRVVRMFCAITCPDGSAFALDARALLQKRISDAAKKGLRFTFGTEFEFYLFNTDENGVPTRIPYDNAGYMDIAPDDKGENVRREICLTLERMGIIPESSHHEEGPGQNEIDFRYSDPLTAADNAVTFKAVVRTIAARNGLYADFSPKPLAGKPGSGLHINISASSDSGADCIPGIVSGLLSHAGEMTAFLNPTEASYARLGSMKAPGYISWSPENRSQLIRIPAAAGEYRRAELRSPDAEANPYAAFTLLIAACADGIAYGKALPEPSMCDLYSAGTAVLSEYAELHRSLGSAADEAGSSAFVREAITDVFAKAYLTAIKKQPDGR